MKVPKKPDYAQLMRDQIDQEEADSLGISVTELRQTKALRKAQDAEADQFQYDLHQLHLKMAYEEEKAFRRKLGSSLGFSVPVHVGFLVKRLPDGRLVRPSDSKFGANHIIFDANLKEGALIRRKGDLLCRPLSKLGKTVKVTCGYDQENPTSEQSRQWRSLKVTCQSCLKYLSKRSIGKG